MASTNRWTPEQLQNARAIVGRLQQEGIDPRVGLIAALTESNLTNVQGGDRDSVGLFQMRSGIWDQGPYKGYAKDVNKQLDWFVDTAKKANRGSGLGDWAANIERPAEQYRGRYAQRINDANAILQQLGGNVSGPSVGTTAQSAPKAAAPQLTMDGSEQLRGGLMAALMSGNDPRKGTGDVLSALSSYTAMRRSITAVPKVEDKHDHNDQAAPMDAASNATPGTILGGKWTMGGGPGDHASRALGNWQSDNAYDLMTPEGTPIYAVAGGVIDSRFGSLGNKGVTAGNRLTVNGNDNRYFYQVKPGDLLGYSGSANGATHLHFAVERGDPAQYFKRPGGK
jgi:murein DD-endopeptidase MepM/ murein hydrolase activator NlpD